LNAPYLKGDLYLVLTLNWVPDAGTTLQLDLEAWRKFFGFDKNGAYSAMTIDVDLDGEPAADRPAWRSDLRTRSALPIS